MDSQSAAHELMSLGRGLAGVSVEVGVVAGGIHDGAVAADAEKLRELAGAMTQASTMVFALAEALEVADE